MSRRTLHRRVIRARIMEKFGTLAAFERANGLAARSVSEVLRGRSVKSTEVAIAKELGVELHRIASRHSAYESTSVDDSAQKLVAHRLTAEAR